MIREEALRQFLQEQKEKLDEHQKSFIDKLSQNVPMLLEQIKEIFVSIGKQAKQQNKEKIVYFHFSLLRCDIASRKYRMLLQAQDMRWFLDPEPIEIIFPVEFLFIDLNNVWDLLWEEQRKYMGKINAYDVDFMVTEEAVSCNLLLGDMLRYFFRDVEDNPEFAAIPKEIIWDIRWGEYRGPSVLVARVDRTPKAMAQWNMELQKPEGGNLNETYWYQAELTGGDCSYRECCFAAFEDCLLKNINFREADLTGTRFKNCRIENCIFSSAILNTVLFEHCQWKGVGLKTALFKQTVFTTDGFPQEELDETQLAEVLVKGE